MKTEEARALLQKYFEGTTTLTEEKELGDFFSKDTLPEELAMYKEWFAGIRETEIPRDTILENDIIRFLETQPGSKPAAKRTWLYTWSGIAASVVIVAGSMLFYLTRPDFPDTFRDPAEAAAYAGKTLAFVSSEYNKGLSALAPVGTLRKAEPLEKSMKTIRKGFSEYNKIQLSNYLK